MKKTALIVVDVQYDFIDGSLAVEGAERIIDPIVHLIEADCWSSIVLSQDFHPPGHISFASTYGKEPLQEVRVPHPITPATTVPQMLWPDHCVQGTHGAEIHERVMAATRAKAPGSNASVDTPAVNVVVIQKGDHANLDGYSAFSLNHYVGFTPLVRKMGSWGIERVVICGLATDYCCHATAVDARKFGFETIVVTDAMRGVNPDSTARALEGLSKWGCVLVKSPSDALELIAR
ncbi:Isochorismatase hydrolase [Tilletiaria anomala UBC 951]|uniref:nicotinamidase n=1 Tax=Tilletiaria anomala (strain ATCC 24038 / CBS 436.72 / UBC 951) TaxID=1037660 RepID=A0A066W2N0_TILAU|nr:Isochorismatase hydrolase [Tilletiaria anomala UBC 951]KDN46798.1 Isochorismatase hydrolase [Tilletiaria anomala UBC 951]